MFRGLEYEKLPSFQERLSTMFPNAKVQHSCMQWIMCGMNITVGSGFVVPIIAHCSLYAIT